MKNTFLGLLAFLIGSAPAAAQQISADEALSSALAMMRNGRNKVKPNATLQQNYRLAHTQTASSTSPVQAPLYYVFDNSEGGFIVAGADQRTQALLGAGETGSYADAMQIPAFRYWCEVSQQGIETALQHAEHESITVSGALKTPARKPINGQQDVTVVFPEREPLFEKSIPVAMPPLLGEINWNQGTPYNNNCPTLNDGNHAATGCVATATAMVMKYHEWPETGTGSISYNSHNPEENLSLTLSADFSQSHYDWSNMLDNYEAQNYTSSQAAAVAKLMSDIGIAEQMTYGSASGTYNSLAAGALVQNFRYDKSLRICNREYYTRDEWYRLICNEIADKRPVMMSGSNYVDMVGHEFVLDGYDATGLVHVNWGWGGMSNGYFSLDYMNPHSQGIGGSNGGYAGTQEISIGISPDRTGTSQGHHDLRVDTALALSSDGNTLEYRVSNKGQQSFYGKIGVAVMRYDELDNATLHSYKLKNPTSLDYNYYTIPSFAISDLNLTAETVGNDIMVIYPVYEEGGELIVINTPLNSAGYAVVYNDPDTGLTLNDMSGGICTPVIESLEVTRAYAGYDVILSATLSVPEGSAELTTPLYGYVFDAGTSSAVTSSANFQIIGSGETRKVDFIFPANTLSANNSYVFMPLIAVNDLLYFIDYDQSLSFQVKHAADPDASFKSAEVLTPKVSEGKKLNIDFTVSNSGGYTELQYVIWLYKYDSSQSFWDYSGKYIAYNTYPIESGDNTFHISENLDLAPGEYRAVIEKYSDPRTDCYQLDFTIYPAGDVNYDGQVNTDDIKALERIVTGEEGETESGDVNQDNAVTVGDISKLVTKIR